MPKPDPIWKLVPESSRIPAKQGLIRLKETLEALEQNQLKTVPAVLNRVRQDLILVTHAPGGERFDATLFSRLDACSDIKECQRELERLIRSFPY